jgi:glycosyltransferase involved in cell wall biosynthesis
VIRPASDIRVFLFSTMSQPFIEEDGRILSGHFRVDRVIASGPGAVPAIVRGVRGADVSIAWFGSVYAALIVFLSKMLGRGSVVIVGGVDASKEPGIGYGIWLDPKKAPLVGYAFRNAGMVLPVGPQLAAAVRRLARYEGHNVRWVPTGYDGETWRPGPSPRRMVTTVAAAWDMPRFRVKGLDFLLDTARAMPDVPFRVVGMTHSLTERLRDTIPKNVEVIPQVPRSEVLTYLQESRVYCQPSFAEAFPNALCEAMLCGCVPVGTNVGGIPTAIGDAGFLVPYGNVSAMSAAILQALDAPEEARQRARERVLKEFPTTRRERELTVIVRELAPRKPGDGERS